MHLPFAPVTNTNKSMVCISGTDVRIDDSWIMMRDAKVFPFCLTKSDFVAYSIMRIENVGPRVDKQNLGPCSRMNTKKDDLSFLESVQNWNGQ